MTPMELVLSRLRAVHKSGAGWEALCPAHDDHRRSLSVTEGEDGRALVKCHAGSGCGFSVIVRAMGLEEKDLFPPKTEPSSRGRIVATYDYSDEKGIVLYQVVRFDPKGFRQRRPDGAGSWTWSLNGCARVLFRLPRILDAARAHEVLWVVEGERDVLALEVRGLFATTNAGGAGKWTPRYAEALKGARGVYVVPDNDPPGRKHAEDVAGSVNELGIPVKVVELPGIPEKGDVSDWLAGGRTVAELLMLAQTAPIWTRGPERATERKGEDLGLPMTRIGDLLAEPAEDRRWLVDGLLVAGGLSLLAAKPKAGKSTMARCLCAAVVGGANETWLGREVMHGPVFYLGLEEKREEVKRHFGSLGVAADADLDVFVELPPADAMERLAASVQQRRPVLVVVDGLYRLVRVTDENGYAEVSRKLEPLLDLARKWGSHVLVTHHENKRALGLDGQDGVLGSTALVGSMDCTVIIRRQRDNRRTVLSTQRYGQDLEETVLALDESGRVSLDGTKAEAEIHDTEGKILEALAVAGEPIPEKSTEAHEGLRARVEARTGVLAKALRQLVEAGRVTRTGDGLRGHPYLYSLPNSGSRVPIGIREPENPKPADLEDQAEVLL